MCIGLSSKLQRYCNRKKITASPVVFYKSKEILLLICADPSILLIGFIECNETLPYHLYTCLLEFEMVSCCLLHGILFRWKAQGFIGLLYMTNRVIYHTVSESDENCKHFNLFRSVRHPCLNVVICPCNHCHT